MVLKRLLVTTLSAFGLGALAAGTALGQSAGEGNIPAPNIFDDQITCSMLVPPMSPTPTRLPPNAADDAMTTLETLIGMGTVEIDTTQTGAGTYADLGYVIPPTGMNCGLGAGMGPTLGDMNIDANDDGDFVDVGDTLAWGSVPKDVADGYSDLLPLFMAVYGDPGGTTGGTARALQAAQKSLNAAVTAGTTGAALTVLQDAVTAAQEAHNKAMAAFNAASGGPVYQAGVAEWMAKAAVTKSVMDYNAQVVKTNMALADLDGMDYANYVPLGNAELITTVVTFDAQGMATIVHSELEQYANADPGMIAENSGSIAENGVTTTTGGNFTTTGQLIVPMSLQDHDNDANTDEVLRPIVNADGTANQVGNQGTPGQGIRDVVMRTRAAAAALKKLRDDNTNSILQPLYDEAYRRAQAEANYYNAEWAEVLADGTNQNPVTVDNPDTPNVNEAAPFSISSRNAAYTTESNKRVAAAADLESKVAAREMATAHVRGQFNNAQSFYEQLVARRMALKASADKDLADATADGGTAPMNLTDAAAAAQKALDAANKAKGELDALFADEDDPTVALLTELLKSGGDDGQALVDAISATYDTAAGAADAAREVVNELTGEGGAVATNTAAIAENASAIEHNHEDIIELDGRVTQNEEDIASNTMMIGDNRSMIMTNTENIATNAGNIMANTTMIGENRGMIETNAGSIMANAGHIMENRGMIETNASGISSNANAIAANMNSIGQNSSAISDNRNMIGELSEDLDVVRAGVAASMALAGMPAINGRGISIGVGSFDGESAFAVGFQIQGEMASFKVGVTSASGATGASAGVGFQF